MAKKFKLEDRVTWKDNYGREYGGFIIEVKDKTVIVQSEGGLSEVETDKLTKVEFNNK